MHVVEAFADIIVIYQTFFMRYRRQQLYFESQCQVQGHRHIYSLNWCILAVILFVLYRTTIVGML
jgi:hypothetical protein